MSRFLGGRDRQHGLQVGAMDHPIGRAIALLGFRAERNAHDVAAGRSLDDADRLRRDDVRAQPLGKAEVA